MKNSKIFTSDIAANKFIVFGDNFSKIILVDSKNKTKPLKIVNGFKTQFKAEKIK